MIEPSISAIIPLYNGQKFIEGAIKSVQGQTVPVGEIIVVDDGSTDDGPEIVNSLAAADDRIRLVRKLNGGQSSARNVGVSMGSFDYVAFLDQDDEWYPTHNEILLKPFGDDAEGRLGFAYANLDEVDADGRMVTHDFLSEFSTVHPKRSIRDCLKEDMYVVPSAALVRRHVLNKVGGFDESLIGYEDDDLFLRIFEDGWKNGFINVAVTRWRIHSSSTSYSRQMQLSRMIYARKLLKKYGNDQSLNRNFAVRYAVPRFMKNIQAECLAAIVGGRDDLARAMSKELLELAQYTSGRARREAYLIRKISGWPGFARVIYGLMSKLRH